MPPAVGLAGSPPHAGVLRAGCGRLPTPGTSGPPGGPSARARFINACKVLGAERQGMLTIHSGRHTCASHLLAAGWPLPARRGGPAVRDMLGHANIATTSVYSHVVVDDTIPAAPFVFAPWRSAQAAR